MMSMVWSAAFWIFLRRLRRSGFVASGARAFEPRISRMTRISAGVGSWYSGLPSLAWARIASGSTASRRPLAICERVWPLAASTTSASTSASKRRSNRMRRPARDSIAATSVVPKAAASRSLSKLTVGFFSSGRDSVFADADGIHDDVAGLAFDAGVDLFHLGVRHHAHAAAFHLLEEVLRSDASHEEDDFQWLDVRAGGDHIDGDGDAGI